MTEKLSLGLWPHVPSTAPKPWGFLHDRSIVCSNEVTLGGPRVGAGWGLVTRETQL